MTKQEAVDILVGVIATNSEEENEALDMAIEALSEPSRQGQRDDLIKRSTAIRLAEQGQIQGFPWQFEQLVKLPSVQPYTDEEIQAMQDLEQAQLDKAYQIGVEEGRKKGEWEIYVISMLDGEGCKCSECGFEGVPYWDYCPNCGADMRGESDGQRNDADT